MIMNRFLTLVTGIAALGFAGGQALAQPSSFPVSAVQPQLSALDQQIQGDNAAIEADRNRMDRDQNNPRLYARDRHQLYEDTEMQEYHRGADEDTGGMHDKGW
jgi:hypothetical protein